MALKTVTNPDDAFVKNMKKRIKANNGYCPNAFMKMPSEKCPCMDFRDMNKPGPCGCGLYIKVADGVEE